MADRCRKGTGSSDRPPVPGTIGGYVPGALRKCAPAGFRQTLTRCFERWPGLWRPNCIPEYKLEPVQDLVGPEPLQPLQRLVELTEIFAVDAADFLD